MSITADCDVTRCLLGLGVAVAVGYVGYCCWTGKCCKGASEASGSTASGRINKSVMLSSEKVVNMVDMEDLSDKTVFCRCWKSKKFPYCDGSHTKHNKECGDNVGPLIVKKKGD